jgi:hypothetical protein
MTVTEAIQSAAGTEAAWYHLKSTEAQRPLSKKSGPIAWRLYSWLKPGGGREHNGPSLDPVTGLRHRRWSTPLRDAAQIKDQSWLETVIAVYSWVISEENPEIDAATLAGMIAVKMNVNAEHVSWVAELISMVSRSGYFNPRTDFETWDRGTGLHGISSRQLWHLQDYNPRVYGIAIDYRDYMLRGLTDNRSVEKADLLYWLSMPNWVEEPGDVPNSQHLLSTFYQDSLCPDKNAFLFGLLYALSEQEPVFSMSQFKETYPQAFAEYKDALPFFQVD